MSGYPPARGVVELTRLESGLVHVEVREADHVPWGCGTVSGFMVANVSDGMTVSASLHRPCHHRPEADPS